MRYLWSLILVLFLPLQVTYADSDYWYFYGEFGRQEHQQLALYDNKIAYETPGSRIQLDLPWLRIGRPNATQALVQLYTSRKRMHPDLIGRNMRPVSSVYFSYQLALVTQRSGNPNLLAPSLSMGAKGGSITLNQKSFSEIRDALVDPYASFTRGFPPDFAPILLDRIGQFLGSLSSTDGIDIENDVTAIFTLKLISDDNTLRLFERTSSIKWSSAMWEQFTELMLGSGSHSNDISLNTVISPNSCSELMHTKTQ